MKKFLAIVLALVMVASLGVCAFADYPDKAINLIVPYNPGGTTDLTARAIANGMSDFLGVTINVNNVAGAGGSSVHCRWKMARMTATPSWPTACWLSQPCLSTATRRRPTETEIFGLQPMLRMLLLFRPTAPTRQLLTWWKI